MFEPTTKSYDAKRINERRKLIDLIDDFMATSSTSSFTDEEHGRIDELFEDLVSATGSWEVWYRKFYGEEV